MEAPELEISILTTPTSILATRDFVEHYHRKCEDEAQARRLLQCEVEFKEGELANERRKRQWLETRLDRVVHALASKEATRKYREERKSEGTTREILELTAADLANERRLREKLEETVKVMERAQAVEQYKKKIDEENKAADGLRAALETANADLARELETVRVLEATIADLERPITEDWDARTEESLTRLETAQCEFVAERRAREQLERKLIELEEAMSDKQQPQDMSRGSAIVLERIQDELTVERRLRERLEKKLRGAEAARAEQSLEQTEDKDDMLQNLLKCTLDKLSNERRVRKTLEERLAALERAVQKEQAKTKFEEIFLELTQNELVEERETRQNLERQLAELAEVEAEEARKKTDEEEYFDAKLEALDKIITSIQEQNRLEQDDIGTGKQEEAKDEEKEGFVDVSLASGESKASEREDLAWLGVAIDSSPCPVPETANVEDYPELVTEEWPDRCFQVEPALHELVVVGTSLCQDDRRWHMIDESAQNAYQTEEVAEWAEATQETGRWETVKEEGNLDEALEEVEPLVPHDNKLEDFPVQTDNEDVAEDIEVSILDATRDVTPILFEIGGTEYTEETLPETNGETAPHENEMEYFSVKNNNLQNTVEDNMQDNVLKTAQDTIPSVFALGWTENTNDTLAELHRDAVPQDNGMEDLSVQNNDSYQSVEEQIEDIILDAARDIALVTLPRTESMEKILAQLHGGTTPHDGDKPGDNQLAVEKLAGIEDQDLEEKLTELGAIKKKKQIEKQPDIQESNDEELPDVYE